jgi:GAF domain-containing protein
MVEQVYVDKSLSKAEQYTQIIPQIKALISGEKDLTANMANVCAVLKYSMNFFWVGFYRVENEELVLNVFQGPPACTRFSIQKGVCGACVRGKKTIIVPNVHEFEGHIACSTESNSEIVLPVIENDAVTVTWVLDIDSEHFNHFDETDAYFLKEILNVLFAD